MRDPNNMMDIVYKDEPVTILKLDQIPEYNIRDFDLNDEKEFKKFIYQIEKTVRTSYEYRQMLWYLRTYVDMNKCSFYENVNNINTFKIKIEIHHEPFTLYDICKTVYNKRLHFNEVITDEAIAKEVMYLHYSMMVGLIPLSETVHELVHNQFLFIPIKLVMGDIEKFITLYDNFIDAETRDTLDRIVEASEAYDGKDKAILNRNSIYVDATGSYKLPKYEDIILMMRNRVDNIKNKRKNL